MKSFLCELKINGCKSLNKEICLKFCNSIVKPYIMSNGSNIKAIYGPNGSGKSAIMTALYIYKGIICSEDGLSNSYLKNLIKETINKETNQMNLEVVFALCKKEDRKTIIVLKHQISIVQKNDSIIINKESISKLTGRSINSGNFKEMISIVDGKIDFIIDEKSNISKLIVFNTLNLLSKQSITQFVYGNYNREDIKKYDSLLFYTLVALVSFVNNLVIEIEATDMHYSYLDSEKFHEYLNETIDDVNMFEFSIKGYDEVAIDEYDEYIKRIDMTCEFIKTFKPNLQKIDIEKKENASKYFCQKLMNYGNYRIEIEFESNGIKKLMKLYNALMACSNGRIVFIDEFDANLHDVYFSKLIEFMRVFAKGQLCFTTHNLEPIDILKNNAHSLDFLSNDSRIISWKKDGNKSPLQKYIKGLIPYSQFDVEAVDFIHSLIAED